MAILDPNPVWPGMTVEERTAYDQSVGLADSEFETAVSEQMGPFGSDQIEADNADAVLYKDDSVTPQKGVTLSKQYRKEFGKSLSKTGKFDATLDRDMEEYYGDLFNKTTDPKGNAINLREKFSNPDEPSIFTFGADAANPHIQSHEFRHVALDALRHIPDMAKDVGKNERANALRYLKSHIPAEGRPEEIWNRQFDSYRQVEDNKNIHGMMQYEHQLNIDKYKGKDIVGAAKELLKKVAKDRKLRGQKFAKMEAASQIYEGNKPPKGTTWREHYFKLFLQRHNRQMSSFKKYFNEQHGTNVFTK